MMLMPEAAAAMAHGREWSVSAIRNNLRITDGGAVKIFYAPSFFVTDL
jgi:hypothetical protein